MISLLVIALALGQTTPRTYAKPGLDAPQAVSIQGVTNGKPIPISGTVNSAGVADTVGSTVTYNSNSVCATVALAGQTSAGFFLSSGTLAATLTPSVSNDATVSSPNCSGGTWTPTKFADASTNTSSTISVTNPNAAAEYTIQLMGGARCARVCTTAFTSGSATGFLVASYATPPAAASGSDVTDRAGRLLGQLTDGASAIVPAKTGQLPAALDASGGVKTHEVGTATVSGTVTANAGTGTFAVSAASLPLPTGAATSAKQPALGTAGTPSADVLTVQGVTSMTPIKTDGSGVTQPVSGTFWQATQPVSAASLPLPTGAAQDATLTGGTQRTKITDGTNNASVKAASTAAVATDNAVVVAVSPNNSVAVTGTFWQATQPVSGTVTANQGTAAALSAKWPVVMTDGTNSMPTMDAAARKGFMAVTDGTNTAAVKAASTAPATTDPAMVVTQSPTPYLKCPNRVAINQTASTDLITGTNKIYVCSWVLISATAQNFSIVEGTGTTCATGIAAIFGGTTASGNLASNTGAAMPGDGWQFATSATGKHLCLLQSSTGNISGMITYADAP